MKKMLSDTITTVDMQCPAQQCCANIFHYDICRNCYWFEYHKFGYEGYCNYYRDPCNPSKDACWKYSE